MSELKAIRSGEIYNIIEYEDCCRTDDLYYPKSEADMIIGRHKYKRCLAMAELCDAEADVADADGDYEDMRWYQKWCERWLELAEKFKPNNSTDQ